MKNEIFKTIVLSKSKTVKGYTPNEPRLLITKQKLLKENTLQKDNIEVTGVKSGFTPEAGRCLVTSAINKEGMEIITVLLNAPKMFESTAELLQNNFKKYKMVNVLSPKHHLSEVMVSGGEEERVHIYHESGFSYPLSALEEGKVQVSYNYPQLILAPTHQGQEIGEVIVSLDGETLFSAPLLVMEDVQKTSIISIIKNIIECYLQNN